MIEDKGLLAVVNKVMNESVEGDAYVASKHHGEAWNKTLQVHKLLAEIHGHLNAAKDCGLGDVHCTHVDEAKDHLYAATAHLDKVSGPLSKANVLSSSKTGL